MTQAEKADQIRRILANNWKEIGATIPEHVSEGRLAASALAAIRRDRKLAECGTESLVHCIVACAQLGIEPNDGTQRAYLIPRGGECTLMLGYRGMIDLAYRSASIASIDCQVIRANDEIEVNLGSDPHILHRPSFVEGRGEMIGVYAVIHLRDSKVPIVEIMDSDDLDRIRAAAGRGSPAWKAWPDEMSRKSVLKRALKRAPLSADQRRAMAIVDEQEAQGIPIEDVLPEVASGWQGMVEAEQEAGEDQGIYADEPPPDYEAES